MRHFLVIIHDSKIQHYFTNAIQKLAATQNSYVWIAIDPSAQPLIPYNWSKLELAVTKRNPIFCKKPFDNIDVNEIIKVNENIGWMESSNQREVDWILLEDATIDITKYKERAKKGFVALQFSYEKIIQESLNEPFVTIKFLYKYSALSSWKSFYKPIAVEKGLKNNCDKALWYFSIFLPQLLFLDFNIENNKINELKKNSKIAVQLAIISYQIRLLGISLKRKLQSKSFNWKIAFEKNDKLFFLNQPDKSFWADPFFIEHEGLKVVFFEELDINGKGVIAALTIDDHFEIIEKQVIIDEKFHLSFPNVFFENNQLYMIPESSANNKVLIYQCDVFPFQWSLKQTVLDNTKLIDAVWFKQNDIYWIFANKIEDFEYDNNERLYLYSTHDLISGNWQSHPINPIVCDKTTARNAGKIIFENNKIIRVSQNCKDSYGATLTFSKIEEISPNTYIEKLIKTKNTIKPFCGNHSWNEATDGFMITDYLTKE